MKLAVLADLHSNLPALQAVLANLETWKPDTVVVAGDTINRGPRPAECLALIQERQRTQGWQVLRGNHEAYVLKFARPDAPSHGPAFEVHRPSYWTYQRLRREISSIQVMPEQHVFKTPDGRSGKIVHASLLGDRDGIYPETGDAELAAKIGQDCIHSGQTPALFVAGHTHRGLVRRLNGTLVVNAGSVGLPFDLDTRSAYAQITWRQGRWRARIVRVPYDLAQAEHDFYTSGYLEEGGPLARLVLLELQQARSMLYGWAIRYQANAAAGEISMEDSVQRYLNR